MCHLFGRPSHNESGQRGDKAAHCNSHQPIGSSRILGELQEVFPVPSTIPHIPRIRSRLQEERAQTSTGKAKTDIKGGPAPMPAGECFSTHPGTANRKAISSSDGYPASTIALPGVATAETSANVQKGIRWPGFSFKPSTGGPEMVAAKLRATQWPHSQRSQPADGDRDGRLTEGMGGSLSRRVYRWLLVTAGERKAHKLPRIGSRAFCSESFSKTAERDQNSDLERQCNDCGIHKSYGWNGVTSPDNSRQGALAMVLTTPDHTDSGTLTRLEECQSRLYLSAPVRQDRFDPQPRDIRPPQTGVGAIGSRAFCQQIYHVSSAGDRIRRQKRRMPSIRTGRSCKGLLTPRGV